MKTLADAIDRRREGNLQDSLSILNSLLKDDPENPMIYFQIAYTHDALGKEADAVEPYKKSIKLGVDGDNRKSAFLGLGSTLRNLGQYKEADSVFNQGLCEFPDYRPLQIFSALNKHNMNKHTEAVCMLLTNLLDTTNCPDIKKYDKSLRFYSDNLDKIFE